jgi:MFS family permease
VFLPVVGGLAAISAVVTADRIGKGLRTAPRDAMIASVSETRDLARAFGVHRTLDTVGAVIGPLLAFVILWLLPNGYTTVLVASLAFALMGLALLGLLVPDRRPRRARGTRRPRWREVADPRLTRLLLVVGGLGVLTVGDGFLYLALLDRNDFAAHWFPLLYVGTNIAYLALAVPVGALADRVGRARMLVLGHLVLVAAYACAALPAAGTTATLAVLVLLGAFYAATDGVTAAVAGRLVPMSVRASGIAAAQTSVAVARLVASTAFGALWFLVGPRSALVLVGAVLVLAVLATYPVMVRLDRRAEQL